MKEETLEVLVYLFKNYIFDEFLHYPNQGELTQELIGAGFIDNDITTAFNWLEGLIGKNKVSSKKIWQSASIRFYNEKELAFLGQDGISLITRLINFDVIDQKSREIIILRIMALEPASIGLANIRWIILMVLINEPEFDEITNWVTGLVRNDIEPIVH